MGARLMKIAFTILGQPFSKANSREIVTRRFKDKTTGESKVRPMSIKSDKAREYERKALLQIPYRAKAMLTGPVRVTIRIWYASERPDLDESVILDVLQAKFETDPRTEQRVMVRAGVYANDRQVREKHIFWGLDRRNPRAEIEVEPMDALLFEQTASDFVRPREAAAVPF
jgi:Holliday junction resolvase RusA-like endonuclease